MRLTETPGRVLATLPGKVHGIVSENPYKIQCDGCLLVQWGDSKQGGAQIILSDVKFNPKVYSADPRRLCGSCRKDEWAGE